MITGGWGVAGGAAVVVGATVVGGEVVVGAAVVGAAVVGAAVVGAAVIGGAVVVADVATVVRLLAVTMKATPASSRRLARPAASSAVELTPRRGAGAVPKAE